MDISVFLGTSAVLGIVYYAAHHDIENMSTLISMHAGVLVGGGTLCAALMCLRIKPVFAMFKIFLQMLAGKVDDRAQRAIQEIVTLAEKQNDGQALGELITTLKNPFLKESLALMESGSLSDDELFEVLEKRLEIQNELYRRQSSMFKTIGKFPPAFGLLGTTLGMISLLQGLGSPDSFKKIGPSMSTALMATFYGLILANVFLIPFGENLTVASQEDLMVRRIVIEGIRLVKDQRHPSLVKETLQSYLTPKDRNRIALKG